ncbi:hypothetical protein HMPREF9120_01986 [Neisseria sp. oral taxon 020 str. F0370]|nr:hypothetical protein HMPREF9120_01986 [Neisseria sp. oral taxon 020 str. F0370]
MGGALVFRLREAFFEDAVEGGKRGVGRGVFGKRAGKQVLHEGMVGGELVAADDKVGDERFEAELPGMLDEASEQVGGGLVHGEDNGQALLFYVSCDVGAIRLGLLFRFGQLGDEVDGVLPKDKVEFVGLVGAHIGGQGLDDVPADFGVVGVAEQAEAVFPTHVGEGDFAVGCAVLLEQEGVFLPDGIGVGAVGFEIGGEVAEECFAVHGWGFLLGAVGGLGFRLPSGKLQSAPSPALAQRRVGEGVAVGRTAFR